MSEEALRSTSTAATEGVPVSPPAQSAVIVQILSTVLFTFLAYMTIGIPLAVLPGYVHLDLGYSSFIAGLSISVQYLSTFITRAQAGRMVDTIGPKKTVMRGMLACVASGVFLVLAAWSSELPWLSLSMILVSRFCLGIGESLAGTGSIIWGIGRRRLEPLWRLPARHALFAADPDHPSQCRQAGTGLDLSCRSAATRHPFRAPI